jgi:hypothetical protein
MNDLCTFKQFVEENKIFTEAALRNIIFNKHQNGLHDAGAILKFGKKIIIDKEKFFIWFREYCEENNKP